MSFSNNRTTETTKAINLFPRMMLMLRCRALVRSGGPRYAFDETDLT